ncbi:MAG TPA: hypothetical protein ENG35_06585 [Desulfobacteraceae bacterium]|nr:hypothetical protein [Desulfobacteraceae bacterium]
MNEYKKEDPCSIEGIFYFDPDDLIYGDHFPGNPVVPGSLIIHSFLKAVEKAGFKSDQYIVENFKFKEFVSPGEYFFNIRIFHDRLKCRLYRNSLNKFKTMVTGIIKR